MTRNIERFGAGGEKGAGELLARLDSLLIQEERNDAEINRVLYELERKYPSVYAERVQIIDNTIVATRGLRREVASKNPDIIEIVGPDGRVRQVLIKRPSAREGRGVERTRTPRGQKESIPLPPQLVNDRGLREQLQKLGILQGNNVVFEDPNWKKEFEKYVETLGFLKKIKYNGSKAFENAGDRKKVVETYLKLANDTASTWLLDKRYLQLQYATAIYNDIIGNGAFLEKTKDNVFVIKKIDATGKEIVDPFPEYKTLLSGPNQNKLLDVAIVVGIMENNFTFDNSIVGQRTLVQKILEQNGIKGPDGNIIDAKLIKIEWANVRKQILEKREASVKGAQKNFQNYQELTHVLNFIDNEEYLKKDYNEEVMSLANTFRIQFRGEKGTLDAMQKTGFDIQKPETWGTFLQNVSSENAGILILAGLFFTFFGGSTWGHLGKAILAGLVGAYVGGGILNSADSLIKGGSKISSDKLELLDFKNLTPVLNLDSKYQSLFLGLVSESNDRISDLTSKTPSRKPFIQNPFVIGKIYYELVQNEEHDIPLATATVDQVYALIKNKSIGGTEFKNNEASLNGTTITKNDVAAFLSLLGEKKESGDVTLRDALERGKDPYGSIEKKNAFGVTVFDEALFEELKKGFDGLPRLEKKKRLELQTEIVTTLNGPAKNNASKIEAFHQKLTTEGVDSGVTTLIEKYLVHLKGIAFLTSVTLPASSGNDEVSLTSQLGALQGSQRNVADEEYNYQSIIDDDPSLFAILKAEFEKKDKEIETKIQDVKARILSLQQAEARLDNAATFGGEKGTSLSSQVGTFDQAKIKSIYTGSNSPEIQDLRKSLRSIILFLNNQYDLISRETSLDGRKKIIENPEFKKAFIAYSDFQKSLAPVATPRYTDSGRAFILDRARSDFPKFQTEIFKLFQDKYSENVRSFGALETKINGIVTTFNPSNPNTFINELQKVSDLRGNVDSLEEVTVGDINSALNSTLERTLTPAATPTASKSTLNARLDQKKNALVSAFSSAVTNAINTATGKEVENITFLLSLSKIDGLPDTSKDLALQAIPTIIEKLDSSTGDSIPESIKKLKDIKALSDIPYGVKARADEIITRLREKFLERKISEIGVLTTRPEYVSAVITILTDKRVGATPDVITSLNEEIDTLEHPNTTSLRELLRIVKRSDINHDKTISWFRDNLIIEN